MNTFLVQVQIRCLIFHSKIGANCPREIHQAHMPIRPGAVICSVFYASMVFHYKQVPHLAPL